jgi:gliding motility-associated-like protein
VKEKNNIEQFDNLFKQQLENARVQTPSGLFEAMSSSISSGASIAKLSIFSKLLIGTVLVSATALVSFFTLSDSKTTSQTAKENSKNTSINSIELSNKNEDIVTKNKIEYAETDKSKIAIIKAKNDKIVPKEINTGSNPLNENSKPNFSENYTITNGNLSTFNKEDDKIVPEIEPKIVEQLEPAHLTTIDSSYIFIPNAVTPNGDGLNDEYLIDIRGEERVQIIIFDKNSHRLFETKNKTIAWKCTLPNGEIAPDGDYIVKVIYTFKNKEQQTKTIKLKLIK